MKSPNRLGELVPDAAKWSPVLRVIDFAGTGSSGYRVWLHANTPEQLALCYREPVT